MTAPLNSVSIYIGEDIYSKLPEKEQETFDTTERYKPDAIQEQIEEAEAAGEEWKDPFGPFKDIQDYEDFWGDDFSQTGGFVYEKSFDPEEDPLSDADEERFRKLSEQVTEEGYGNQLRVIKEHKLSWIVKKTPDGILIPSEYMEFIPAEDGQEYELKIGRTQIRLSIHTDEEDEE